MSSTTTPDFQVVGGGMSTLNTNLTVKGTDDLVGTTGLLVENNSGNDLFFIKNNGTFALGKGATAAGGYSAVSIGGTATAASNYSVSIGNASDATSTYAIAIGSGATGAQATGQDAIVIGGNGATASGNNSVAIGYTAQSTGDYCINVGRKSKGTGDNSITFNATTDAIAAPSANTTFGVYMTSNTAPDFEVVGGGESTFNTSVKITGQAYTELHDTTNTTLTVNWNNSNIQELTSLTGSLTFTASNPKAGATYILTLAQTGTVTATWTGVKWPAATAPTLSGAGKTDVVTLICYDATANAGAGAYYGASTLNFTT